MTSNEGDESPKIASCDEEIRSQVLPYVQISKFKVGDKVYIRTFDTAPRKGPYFIAKVIAAGLYTLSLENGKAINDGAEIEEQYLEAA